MHGVWGVSGRNNCNAKAQSHGLCAQMCSCTVHAPHRAHAAHQVCCIRRPLRQALHIRRADEEGGNQQKGGHTEECKEKAHKRKKRALIEGRGRVNKRQRRRVEVEVEVEVGDL